MVFEVDILDLEILDNKLVEAELEEELVLELMGIADAFYLGNKSVESVMSMDISDLVNLDNIMEESEMSSGDILDLEIPDNIAVVMAAVLLVLKASGI